MPDGAARREGATPLGRPRLRPWFRVLPLTLLVTLLVLARSNGPEATRSEAPAQLGGLFLFGHHDGGVLDSPHLAGDNPQVLWSDLEPQEGVYNWRPLDSAIAATRSTGRRVIPRVYTNVDGIAQASPSWFFAGTVAAFYYPSRYAASRDFKAPVPWDPLFQQKFGRFLTALGKRYDGEATIEFWQTNAGGGQYGEMLLSTETKPPGWSPEVQLASIVFWLERWLGAFSRTHLSIMLNHLEAGLGEDAAAYAAARGVYLQQNSPWLGPEAVSFFTANQQLTRIVLEVEDAGCRSATGAAFDALIDRVFSYGFAIDYMTLCRQTFADAQTASGLGAVAARLRRPSPE